MEHRFIHRAVLLVRGNRREKDFDLAQLFMFHAMGPLVQSRLEWTAKRKREKLHLGRLVALYYISQLKHDGCSIVLMDFELGVQLFAQNSGVQIIQRRRHREPTA